jgi:hypothetical protein
VLGDTPGIRHDRQGGIDARSGREWAAVHHEEVVDLVAPHQRSSTEVSGSLPMRVVPCWCEQLPVMRSMYTF